MPAMLGRGGDGRPRMKMQMFERKSEGAGQGIRRGRRQQFDQPNEDTGSLSAMAGDTRLTYWGAKPDGNWSNETTQKMGCYARKPGEAINEIIGKMGE